jgi:hypothetical protein
MRCTSVWDGPKKYGEIGRELHAFEDYEMLATFRAQKLKGKTTCRMQAHIKM